MKNHILANYKKVINTISNINFSDIKVDNHSELVVVTKNQSIDNITPLLELGHLDFGENRYQEAYSKWSGLKKEYPKAKLHFIGHIQTNKAKEIFDLCDIIHSLDSIKLAEKFASIENSQAQKKEYYIQVNIGREPQKSGIMPDEIDKFIIYNRNKLGLNIQGLMCIPPVNEPASLYFGLLKTIAKRNNLINLSMGMSSDYESAVILGAKYLRIGSKIFA